MFFLKKENNNYLVDKNGRLIPDFIGRFENLEKDYKKLCKKIGIKKPPKIPHKKKSRRKVDYREYYNEETKMLVKERYKEDLRLFGHGFK